MRYSFESQDSGGNPRRFVGMHRPTFEDVYAQHSREGGWLVYHVPGQREAWLRGQWDVPLYEVEA